MDDSKHKYMQKLLDEIYNILNVAEYGSEPCNMGEKDCRMLHSLFIRNKLKSFLEKEKHYAPYKKFMEEDTDECTKCGMEVPKSLQANHGGCTLN